MTQHQKKISILTGEKAQGKTTFIKNLVFFLHHQGFDVKGLLSPGLFEGNQKIGILVMNLADGEQRQLACHDPGWDPARPEREWRFNVDTVLWGDQILKSINSPCDVLIVDEIGYLELENQQGWQAVFSLLEGDLYRWAVIVVRESLLPLAKATWDNAEVIHLNEINVGKKFFSNIAANIRKQKAAHRDRSQTQL